MELRLHIRNNKSVWSSLYPICLFDISICRYLHFVSIGLRLNKCGQFKNQVQHSAVFRHTVSCY